MPYSVIADHTYIHIYLVLTTCNHYLWKKNINYISSIGHNKNKWSHPLHLSGHEFVILVSTSLSKAPKLFLLSSIQNVNSNWFTQKSTNGSSAFGWWSECVFRSAAEMQARPVREQIQHFTQQRRGYISIIDSQTFSLEKRAFPWNIRWQKAFYQFVWSAAKMDDRVFKHSLLCSLTLVSQTISIWTCCRLILLSICLNFWIHVKASRAVTFFLSLSLARLRGISTLDWYTQHSSTWNYVHVALYNFGFRLRKQSQIREHYLK